ncbi:MAG: DNA topoisomerase I [Haloarculaceae archaeon]
MELIVTEKENAARRIAEILSESSAETERRNGVSVYRWGDTRVVGLSGHVVGVDFPPEYANWRDVEPVELIDAEVVTEPTQENIVRTLRELAGEADRVTIATDYDREGELIGKEAYELVREETDAPVDRVRFSSITDREVREAFAEPDEIDFDLAAAGEARQTIDLVWGAALTRFLSLSARQLGNDFISVGRVQSPTLKLIVDREREIQAFDPEDYWELFADLARNGESFEAQYFYDDDGSEAERVWEESAAETAHERLQAADAAEVTSVRRRTRTDEPPAPFNTTAFISAAGSLGYSAQRAMSVAEELYTAGYLTYPRTDNTVYPEDLDPEELVETFVGGPFDDSADHLLDLDELEPTEGEEETTDHPPIHPTGEVPDRGDLSEDEWELYELVVRRFFATVAEPATWAHLRVVAEANGCQLKANGKRLVEPGYHEVYPYPSTSETVVPDVSEGDRLDVAEVRLEAKQTQPPRRYGQSRLIREMESRGLGTKCLTGDTRILCRNSKGDFVRKQVGDLFDEKQVVVADGDTDIAVATDDTTVLSFDERAQRIAEYDETLVSRRALEDDETVLSVETTNGKFSVTDDHPLYLRTRRGVEIKPASEIRAGDELVSARREVEPKKASDGLVLSWESFASACDKDSKLYGTGCNDAVAQRRAASGESQAEFASQYGTDHAAVSDYENGKRDVPIWLLGELDIRPDALHGLNYDTTITNPFPLAWSPELARLLANLLGDGSIHVDEDENVVDVRYHNTDRRLVDRFVADIEALFDTTPTVSERPGREEHHRDKYQVSPSSALSRVLVRVLDTVTEDGCPAIPGPLQPAFVGALFDDEGHVSRERKAFISNTDHELLAGVADMLENWNIETTLSRNQHKLHIRGRENLERFFDSIPVAADRKFYRGFDALQSYDVTTHKHRLLDYIDDEPKTTDQLASALDLSRGQVSDRVRDLRTEGYVQKRVEGSNRSKNGLRTIRYTADGAEKSIYATLNGQPAATTVTGVTERSYDGPVYDITVDSAAPNFAVEGGIIVHNSTRHNTIEKLYDRGYIEGDPPRPTKLAEAVVEAAEAFADRVVSEEMTAQLEADMDAIASGEATLEEVTAESREMLEAVFEELRESREAVGDHLQESLKADRRLGPCPECGEDLLVRQSRDGSYFVGCDGFPDCRFTLPLPSTGEPLVIEEVCEEHDTNHVKMLAGRDTFVHGCPRCAAAEADDSDDEVVGPCPECGGTRGGELAVKHLRSGSRLAGCTRYPDCEYSLPLPRNGEIEVTDTYCEEHDLPELVVQNGEDPWELGCPVCNYREYRAEQAVEALEDLEGVGAATAEKLESAGVESPADLENVDPEAVAADIQGVSADRLREWQEQVEVA